MSGAPSRSAMVRPRRQPQLLHRRLQESLALLIERAVAAQLAAAHAAVQNVAVAPETLLLHAAGVADLLEHHGAERAVGGGGQLLERRRRQLDVEVDAVQKRAAQKGTSRPRSGERCVTRQPSSGLPQPTPPRHGGRGGPVRSFAGATGRRQGHRRAERGRPRRGWPRPPPTDRPRSGPCHPRAA